MRLVLCSLVALVGWGQGFIPQKATIADLLKEGSKWDKKEVAVIGYVAEFKQKTSRNGNDYYTFKLVEKLEGKPEFISVYGQGKLSPAPIDKAHAVVSGVFAKEKSVGDQTFRNEVDVTPRGDKKFGVKVLKKIEGN